MEMHYKEMFVTATTELEPYVKAFLLVIPSVFLFSSLSVSRDSFEYSISLVVCDRCMTVVVFTDMPLVGAILLVDGGTWPPSLRICRR